MPADERLASIARSPEIHVVAGSAEHDVAVRRTARRRSAVRPAEDDVPAWTTVHHIVAVQAKHHIVARSADEDVGAIERLVRDGARLNRHVVLSVIVASDEKLRPFAVFASAACVGRAPSATATSAATRPTTSDRSA